MKSISSLWPINILLASLFYAIFLFLQWLNIKPEFDAQGLTWILIIVLSFVSYAAVVFYGRTIVIVPFVVLSLLSGLLIVAQILWGNYSSFEKSLLQGLAFIPCLLIFLNNIDVFYQNLMIRFKTQGVPDWLLRITGATYFLTQEEAARVRDCYQNRAISYVCIQAEIAMAYKQKHGTLPPEYLTEPSEA